MVQHNMVIKYSAAMVEYRSYFELAKDTPYLVYVLIIVIILENITVC